MNLKSLLHTNLVIFSNKKNKPILKIKLFVRKKKYYFHCFKQKHYLLNSYQMILISYPIIYIHVPTQFNQ